MRMKCQYDRRAREKHMTKQCKFTAVRKTAKILETLSATLQTLFQGRKENPAMILTPRVAIE